jgi:hypothetical protein
MSSSARQIRWLDLAGQEGWWTILRWAPSGSPTLGLGVLLGLLVRSLFHQRLALFFVLPRGRCLISHAKAYVANEADDDSSSEHSRCDTTPVDRDDLWSSPLELRFTNTDLSEATFSGATVGQDTRDNTTCPDGTNSNNDGDNCCGRTGRPPRPSRRDQRSRRSKLPLKGPHLLMPCKLASVTMHP